MSTNVVSAKEIKRTWHLVDVRGKVLGRIASEIAQLLLGKNKASFVPYLDTGDYVVVVNASSVKVTGKKEDTKKYARHSGFPGGYREETLAELRKSKPEEIIKHAVWGMMPKTKLGRQMIKKLHIFAGKEHDFKDKFAGEKDDER